MLGHFFDTTINYKLYNISKIMTMCPVFQDHQKCYFKEVFQNKLFWCLLSPDCKDALYAICLALAFLLDIMMIWI